MKQLSKIFILATVVAASLFACKKDENKIFFEGGKSPALTASIADAGTIPLSFVTKDKEAVKFFWTNPDYQFTTGLSSQSVTYTLQIDTVGANFTNPKMKSVAFTGDLGTVFTQLQFNDFLTKQLELETDMLHKIQVRVKASLGSGTTNYYSNAYSYNVTPFSTPPAVDPPASGTLYMTGAATPAGWMSGGDPENLAQKFTKKSNTLYELASIALNGGASYLLVPVYGDWSNKFGGVGANNSNNPDGDQFRNGGGDLLAPASSGNYKVTVNFQTGKFFLTKL